MSYISSVHDSFPSGLSSPIAIDNMQKYRKGEKRGQDSSAAWEYGQPVEFGTKESTIFCQSKRDESSMISGGFGLDTLRNDNYQTKNEQMYLEDSTSPVISSKDMFNEFRLNKTRVKRNKNLKQKGSSVRR